MKNLLEFKLNDGESAYMQITETKTQTEQRGSRDSNRENTIEAPRSFEDAIKCVAPIGNALLTSLKDINTPDEIDLEFSISFNGKAGVVFTSVESEASFKVHIKWKNQ